MTGLWVQLELNNYIYLRFVIFPVPKAKCLRQKLPTVRSFHQVTPTSAQMDSLGTFDFGGLGFINLELKYIQSFIK